MSFAPPLTTPVVAAYSAILFKIPRPDEITNRQEIDDLQIDLPQAGDDDMWDFESDSDDFESDTPLAREERRGFETRPTRAGIELLAVYRPFHFYPEGHWGVHFIERPMAQFAQKLVRRFARARRPETHRQILKIAFYSVARHEFQHYLTELEALDLELKQGRSIYRPYWDNVYKKAYPGLDCVEETLASMWNWDSPVAGTPADIKTIFRDAIRANPFAAYSGGADLIDDRAHEAEDVLAARLYRCVPRPANPPPVWGSLPRAYHQPWTRYENVTFSMNKSYGGSLGPILNAGHCERQYAFPPLIEIGDNRDRLRGGRS